MKFDCRSVALAVSMLGAVPLAGASVSAVGSVAALAPNDTVSWGQLGATGTAASCFCSWVSAGGNTGGINATDGLVRRRDEGNGFLGDFTLGDQLIFQPNSETAQLTSEAITLSFANPVKGIGAQFDSLQLGAFTMEVVVRGVGNTNLGTFVFTGTNNGLENGSAPFFGVLSTAYDITGVSLLRINPPPSNLSIPFAFNSARLVAQAVPEPASYAMLAVGGVMVLAQRRRAARRLRA